jgi:hypothetical protein
MKLHLITGLLSLAWTSLLAAAPALTEEQRATAGANAAEIQGFLEAAAKDHGAKGEKAALFLVEGMPSTDLKALKKDFLLENLALAMKAQQEFPWAKKVPEEIFLNDVLPYASLDETREAWRAEFYQSCREIVKESKSATEASQAINREFFNTYKVHYNTKRKRPNQSPNESKELGMATCTGLSIILVDACRSVGVPARVAGTALWANKQGNHTWVEIWDGGWHFTGADEYSEKGLNQAWFTGDASKAIADDWKHAIWATSWKDADAHFPMVWDLKNQEVAGVNVTSRYLKESPSEAKKLIPVHFRIFEKQGGERLVVEIDLLATDGSVKKTVTTKAGTADMNDMATLKVKQGKEVSIRLRHKGETKTLTIPAPESEMTKDYVWSALEALPEGAGLSELTTWLALLPEERHLSVPAQILTKETAAEANNLIFSTLKKEAKEDRKAELARQNTSKDGSIKEGLVQAAGKDLKVLEKTFGEAPEGGHSLWISMHGGGGAPARVNDQQWKNQIGLYEPKEGIYVAPRGPTDTWNLWHEGHIDALFDRMIENYIIDRGVNPDRIYLMGFSAGGDGVYQLAPRMADRFAGASMMAGHPGNASPLGLRNLPFMIWMGANDGAYNRNKVAVAWGEKLDKLAEGDPGAYVHETHLVEGKGHWMDRLDAAAVPWMAKNSRTTWPKKIVWHQNGRTHDRFYWLSVPEKTAKRGQTIKAEVVRQKIALESKEAKKITLRLNDALLDLDQEIIVELNGKEVFRGLVTRSAQAIFDSLNQRLDPRSAATAVLTVGG